MKLLKRFLKMTGVVFLLMNIVAFFHAWHFTHFSTNTGEKTGSPQSMSVLVKVKTILFGISNPRPENATKPALPFEDITLQSHKKIACWMINKDSAKGTVILFHGFSGEKSSMLDKAAEFLDMGYNTMLVDFMGSGRSEGNQTTIGFKEANDVETAYNYLRQRGEKNICLFGTSMGAAAILKAVADRGVTPDKIILECPFGSMYQTTCARFKTMRVPVFPMAGLLIFWGGLQNGFWAFGHNPSTYAKAVKCPALLLYGAKDEKVSIAETNDIFNNLQGKKQLKIYPEAGHENYLHRYKNEWRSDVVAFLSQK